MLKQIPLPNSTLQVSELALGAATWGATATLDTALELYDLYRNAGGNIFDTAHIYFAWIPGGEGKSEQALGQVLRARNDRHNVLIMTKGGHPPASFYKHPANYLSPEAIAADITDSLNRLDLPFVDLYLLHRDDRRVPVSEIIHTLNAEVAGKRIRHFGVSNWRPARIAEANAYAKQNNLHPIICSQPQFNLAHPNTPADDHDDRALRFLTSADIAWHEQTQLPAFCYSSTAQGYFATNGKSAAESYENPTSRARLNRAVALAEKHNATPTQIALAWLRHQNFPAIPLLGTSNPAHLKEALSAASLQLTPAELVSLTNQ